MTTETAVETTTPPAAPVSRWEDFVDVFLSPSELFRRRANDGWLLPFAVGVIASMVLYYAFIGVNGALTEASVTSNTSMTAEQQASAIAAMDKFKWLGGIAIPIFGFVITMLYGFLAWLVSKGASVDLPFRRALMITSWTGFILIVQQLAMYLTMAFKLRSGAELDRFKDSSFGVLRFMNTTEMNQTVAALLSRIDLFAFWQMAWIAIALMAACKASRGSAWFMAAVLWLVGVLPVLIPTLFQG